MKIQKKTFLFLLIFGLVLSTYGEDKNCTTSKCHKKFKDMNVIHSPVDEDCTTCHIKKGDHKFAFENKEKLCFECHDDKVEGKIVHEAMSSGECTDCHDPHGGKFKGLLKAARIDTTCFECHEKEPMGKKFVHGPNASGNCTLCHDAHSSNNKKLLIDTETKICTRCHTDKDFSGDNLKIHSPLKKGCAGCHNPHSSDFKFQLLKDSETLCVLCHEKTYTASAKAVVKHPVVEVDKKCYNCHDPHGSSFENNLKKDPLSLCIDCHNKKLKGTDGKYYNIYNIVKNSKYKHGPIEEGNCSGCHNPHGSDFYMILKGKYPKNFYTPYKKEKYNICFQCHENTLAQNKKTTTQTDFRDGDNNLHFIHVNMKKGRTCRACHEIHAGDNAKHILTETPFGKWSLPIGFEKRKDGGYCAPGCHKAYSYSRKIKGVK